MHGPWLRLESWAVLHRFVSNASFHLWLESVFFQLLLGLLRDIQHEQNGFIFICILAKMCGPATKGENNLDTNHLNIPAGVKECG